MLKDFLKCCNKLHAYFITILPLCLFIESISLLLATLYIAHKNSLVIYCILIIASVSIKLYYFKFNLLTPFELYFLVLVFFLFIYQMRTFFLYDVFSMNSFACLPIACFAASDFLKRL